MSQLNPSEISSVLKEKIAGLDLSAERKNEGIVVSVSDGIVRIHGMGDVMYGEVIEFENGTKGMALNLEQDSVGAVVLGDYLEIIEGQKAVCTGKVLEVPVGEGLLGRVVNTLGTPIDGNFHQSEFLMYLLLCPTTLHQQVLLEPFQCILLFAPQ